MELQGPNDETRSIHTGAFPIREETVDQLILSFLQAFDAKWHSTQRRDLLFGVTQGEMTEEALVILIYVVIDQRLLAHEIIVHTAFKPFDDLFQDRLIADISSSENCT